MRATLVCALAALLLAACSSTGDDTAALESQAAARDQSFGPDYPSAPPAGLPTRIETAYLSADQKTITITFIGGGAYRASNPCSTAYEPWVGLDNGALDVTVIRVARQGQATLAPNEACTLEGYLWTFHLALAAPFTGAIVHDLDGGGAFYLSIPPHALVATALPAGWSLQRSFEQEPGPPAIWVEIYAAAATGDTAEGPGRLVLYQAFGRSGEWSDTRTEKSRERGGAPVTVSSGSSTVQIWVDSSTGELLVPLVLAGNDLGLVGNTADMTPEQIATYAEAVTPQP